MNRRIFLMSVSGAASGCFRVRGRRLNVYNWENYVAKSTVPDFEREFRCRVRYATYGSAEEMLAKVMTGNSGWDVVFPSNSFVRPMLELGLLAPLHHSALPNLRNLAPEFQHPAWDDALQFCTPYMFSGTGILYSKHVAQAPAAWADMWSDRYRGRMTMLDDPAEVFAVCLLRLRDSINSANPSRLKRARDLAIAQKPLLRAYLNEEARDQVVAGDILVAQMWAQVAQVAMDNSNALEFCFPEEGFALYADNAAILRESHHQELAHEFLNYVLRPNVAAQICHEMRTATANAAARLLLGDQGKVLYPDAATLARGQWFAAILPAAQQLRDRYWTEIKSA